MLLLVALLVPVVLKLTGRSQSEAGPDNDPQVRQQSVATTVRMEFVHAPVLAALMQNGENILEARTRGTSTSVEAQLELDLGEGLLEMPFTVIWPEGTPRTAVTISFEPDGMEAREVTFWSEGDLDEFIELHWDD